MNNAQKKELYDNKNITTHIKIWETLKIPKIKDKYIEQVHGKKILLTLSLIIILKIPKIK